MARSRMLHRLLLPAAALLTTAMAADLSAIPFLDAAGKETSLKAYQGKVVFIVNVASKCGNTPQYTALEALYRTHQEAGLVVLGFPCNDFGGQEPGTIGEIQTFCKTTYDVTFPLMGKIHVKGNDQHPFYAALTGPQAAFPGNVTWNFGKFLIGRDGKPLARFDPKVKPDAPEITAAIDHALGK